MPYILSSSVINKVKLFFLLKFFIKKSKSEKVFLLGPMPSMAEKELDIYLSPKDFIKIFKIKKSEFYLLPLKYTSLWKGIMNEREITF